MQLAQIMKKHFERFIHEMIKNPGGFAKTMLPRTKVEMPLYPSVATMRADLAKEWFKQKGTITLDDVHALVCEEWMASLRILELAALDGQQTQSEEMSRQVLLGDDPLGGQPTEAQARASEEAARLITKVLSNPSGH